MTPRKQRVARETASTQEGPTQANADAGPKGARAIIVVSVKKEFNLVGCEGCCWGMSPAWVDPAWFYGWDYVDEQSEQTTWKVKDCPEEETSMAKRMATMDEMLADLAKCLENQGRRAHGGARP